MLSKEEIYNLLKEKFRAQKDYWPTAHSDYLEIFYSAMDEYAKQEAIEFALWLDKKQYHLNELGEWEDFDFATDEVFTIGQLYQQYLNSKANATK